MLPLQVSNVGKDTSEPGDGDRCLWNARYVIWLYPLMVKLKNDNGIKILYDTGNRAYNDRADNEMARITKRFCCWGLFCLGFFCPTRIHSYWVVTITGEELQILEICSALMAIEQSGFFSVPHLLRQGSSVYNGNIRGSVTLTLISERFGSGAVTTCFYDLSLSQLGFKYQT